MSRWVNVDEHHGVPSQPRVDVTPPPNWRLDAIAAVGRPHHLTIDPAGTALAFILDADDRSELWVVNVDGAHLRRLTTDREPVAFWEDTPPAWSPDGTRIAYVADGWILVVAVAGGPPRRLIEGGSPQWLDAATLIVSVDRDRTTRLCRVSVDDPWPVPFTPADGSASSPAISPDGRRIAYLHSPNDDRRRSDLRVVGLDDGDVATVVSTPGFFTGSPAFAPDGRTILYTSERTGWKELHVLEDGLESRLTHADADFASVRFHPAGDRIVAVRTRAGVGDLVSIDRTTGDVTVLSAGGAWSDPHWTADGGVVAVYEDHATPPQLRVVAPDGAGRSTFSAIPAAISAAPHVSPEIVQYPSFDGLQIPGFLFRPRTSGGRRHPVVVYPHGGPTSHYGDEWDGHAQYFLDKGYGWFAINFRGSTSYGLEFEHADHGVWGVADTEDCLAACEYLAGLDWVDPDRIAIFGASYGSYLALAALARDPRHRFACGVAKYGDCDILTSWAQGDQVGSEDLERMMGHPSEARASYVEGSPIHRVAAIERPLLIAHGELDTRVHPKQSQQLVDTLRRHDKAFEYVTYPTEGHGLLRRGPQMHFYRRLERFLDWYLM